MITSNVLKHLESYDILTDCQYGLGARICETQLLTLAQELLAGLDKKHQHDLIILDFSNAFERVPHRRLMRKLDHYGIRGSTYNSIEAFLTALNKFWLKTPLQTASQSSAGYHKEQSYAHYYSCCL